MPHAMPKIHRFRHYGELGREGGVREIRERRPRERRKGGDNCVSSAAAAFGDFEGENEQGGRCLLTYIIEPVDVRKFTLN